MGNWANEVAGHPARARAQECRVKLEQLRDRVEDAPTVAEWDRLNVLVTEAEGRLSNTDPNRMSTPMLDRMDAALISMSGTLDAIIATPESETINFSTAVPQANDLAEAMVTLPPLPADEAANQVQASIENVRIASETALTNMEQRLQAAAIQSDELRQALSQITSDGESALQSLRDEVSGLSEAIALEKGRLDEALRANQATFDQNQAQRQSDYTTRVDAAEQAFRDAQDAAEAEARTKAEAAELAANKHVASLSGFVERAKEQVGVIGRTGMSAGYQKDADKEESAADFWRYVTIGIALAAAAVLGWAVYIAAHDETATPEQLIGKALLSATLGGIATYTARQSGHHRANARAARNLELKLLSIGSYLEPLDGERQKQVLEVFAYLLFTGSSEQGIDDSVAMGPTNIQTLIDKISPTH